MPVEIAGGHQPAFVPARLQPAPVRSSSLPFSAVSLSAEEAVAAELAVVAQPES
jgi:hypothetical protein